MEQYRIISADTHVMEPPDLWSKKIEQKFADRAPRLVSEEAGDWWYVDGVRVVSLHNGNQPGIRFEAPEKLKRVARWDEIVLGAYIPTEHVKAMEVDGVSAAVLYPSVPLTFFLVRDSELLTAIFRCYNNWIAEFCSAFCHRCKGVALINLDDVQEGVRELERAAGLGLAGALISVAPPEERSYDRAIYDPFWAAAQDLDLPVSLHVATNRQEVPCTSPLRDPTGLHPLRSPAISATRTHWVQLSLANMMFGGVFERYPKLKVVSVENDLAWVPHLLRYMDDLYTQLARRPGDRTFRNNAIPSDFFHNNVFLSFQEDAVGVYLRSQIGIDNILWGSDYPHHETTWPRSRQILDHILAGVPRDEAAKIVGGNVDKVYHFR